MSKVQYGVSELKCGLETLVFGPCTFEEAMREKDVRNAKRKGNVIFTVTPFVYETV